MAGLNNGLFFLVSHDYFYVVSFQCVCVNLLEADCRRQRTESKRVSLDDILEPVKGELASHFTLKDIVQLSYVCKFLYIWAHSVCELLEESISGGAPETEME